MVKEDDEEVLAEEAQDEFAEHFTCSRPPNGTFMPLEIEVQARWCYMVGAAPDATWGHHAEHGIEWRLYSVFERELRVFVPCSPRHDEQKVYERHV